MYSRLIKSNLRAGYDEVSFLLKINLLLRLFGINFVLCVDAANSLLISNREKTFYADCCKANRSLHHLRNQNKIIINITSAIRDFPMKYAKGIDGHRCAVLKGRHPLAIGL
jgi:hypothetical protein